MKKIPVTIIAGYLGSGKTTLLNNFLSHKNSKGLAVIVNDLGSVNVDARLLKDNVLSDQMIEMQNGCICCTLREQFMKQIEDLTKNPNVKKIIVEASGVSNPVNIAEGFLSYQEDNPDMPFYLDSIISVSDANRLYSEFLTDFQEEDKEESDVINLVVDQIEFCNIVVLNKCDLVSKDGVKEVRRIIRELQPEATIIETINSEVDYNLLFTGKEFDFEHIYDSSSVQKSLNRDKRLEAAGLDDFGIVSFVYESRKPFNRERFLDFLENRFPTTIIRSKGCLWFSDDEDHISLFETAGKNSASLDVYSNWVASLEEEDQKESFENYPEIKENWDPLYGDRYDQIVIIGKDMNEAKIRKELDSCLDDYQK